MTHDDSKVLKQLETALEAAGLAWWWMEIPSGAVFFSPNKARMIDRLDENFFHYNDFMKLVHPDDSDRIMQDMMNLIKGKADKYETTYRIKAKDGTYRQFYDKGRIVSRKGGELAVAGIVLDISSIDLAKIAKFSARPHHEKARG